nr:MAG TPA: Sporulation protein Cse60 [Caudoviricetes sp.]
MKMKKVKVFKFEVTNFTYTADEKEMKQEACKRAKNRLSSTEQIEQTINEWLAKSGYELCDLKVNTVVPQRGEINWGDTVELWYTVVYQC